MNDERTQWTVSPIFWNHDKSCLSAFMIILTMYVLFNTYQTTIFVFRSTFKLTVLHCCPMHNHLILQRELSFISKYEKLAQPIWQVLLHYLSIAYYSAIYMMKAVQRA